eukprot:CAMPEP_0169064822 /NCGR_PEP_ID=MMETSP1015-20121227/2054_1 /TAXON_ID=342587 /ORGANISM="Karlodinium micrum, Strain CCMP2283" /LENGTH=179 /DNA_ID=CAMNT_0009123313 /DNA_START=111 /DNA_END=651 /DNA_ORIENTATION=+
MGDREMYTHQIVSVFDEAPTKDDDSLEKRWRATLSRESTDAPNEEEDYEIHTEESDEYTCFSDEPGRWSAGNINVSLAQKTPEYMQFERCPVAQEPIVGKCTLGVTQEESDLRDNILVRQAIDDGKTHCKYFEDVKWQRFDPEFAQWLLRFPLRPILEDIEEMEDDEDAVDGSSTIASL